MEFLSIFEPETDFSLQNIFSKLSKSIINKICPWLLIHDSQMKLGTDVVKIFTVYRKQKTVSRFNWFRCYHTRCDNRHRILSRWFQLDY